MIKDSHCLCTHSHVNHLSDVLQSLMTSFTLFYLFISQHKHTINNS